jgi:hypothetical protein
VGSIHEKNHWWKISCYCPFKGENEKNVSKEKKCVDAGVGYDMWETVLLLLRKSFDSTYRMLQGWGGLVLKNII